jgi:hypothetical protein
MRQTWPKTIALFMALVICVASLMTPASSPQANELDRFKKFVKKTVSDGVRYATRPDELAYDLLAKKSVEEFSNTLTKAKADANTILSEHETIVDNILKENQHILAGYVSDATVAAGQEANAQIAELGLELGRRSKALELSSQIAIWRLIGSLESFIIWILVLVCIGYAGAYLLFFRNSKDQASSKRTKRQVLAIAVVTCTGVVAWAASQWMRSHATERLIEDHQLSFDHSLAALDLKSAQAFATNLEALTADGGGRMRVELMSLMRRVLTSASAYKKDGGLGATLDSLQRLRAEYYQLCGTYNPYVDVLESLVLWQASRDRYGEYQSALLAARALSMSAPTDRNNALAKECNDSVSPTTFPLWSLAVHYLRNYLTQPLTQDELAAYLSRTGELRDPDLKVQLENAQLESTYKKAVAEADKVAGEMGDQIEAGSLAAFRVYGNAATSLVRKTTATYSVLAWASSMYAITQDRPMKNAYAAAAIRASQVIAEAYDSENLDNPGFGPLLGSRIYDGTNARHAALRDSHSLHYRALVSLRDATGPRENVAALDGAYRDVLRQMLRIPGRPPKLDLVFDIKKFAGVAHETSRVFQQKESALYDGLFEARMLRYIRDETRPYAFAYITEDAFNKLKADTGALSTFEDELTKFLSTSRQYEIDLAAGRASDSKALNESREAVLKIENPLGLFVCTPPNQYCSSPDEFAVKPFLDLLYSPADESIDSHNHARRAHVEVRKRILM